MVPVFGTGSRGPRGEEADATCPPARSLLPQWGQKNASKSDSRGGLSRMESVCAGEGFYQRRTLTGIPVWDCPSNSCVPQEALHKKQLKNAQRHFICRQSTHGEHRELAILHESTRPSFKRNWPHGRVLQCAAAPAARARGRRSACAR